MPAIQQYALLVVVVIPVAVVLAMNLFLFLFGERCTLLLPRPSRYPRIELADEPAPQDAIAEPGIVVIEDAPLRKAA